jgi:hypothetical protein
MYASTEELLTRVEQLLGKIESMEKEIYDLKAGSQISDSVESLEKPIDSDEFLENYEVPAGHILALRTSLRNKRTKKVASKYDPNFEWPERPQCVVFDSKFSPEKSSGQGLHALKWGIGNYLFFEDQDTHSHEIVWQVVCVNEKYCIDLGSKIKFARCVMVLSTSDKQKAFAFINKHAPKDLTPELRKFDQDRVSGYVVLDDYYTENEFLELPLGPVSNVYSSRLKNGKHAPAIDIDVPFEVVESSTPGHGHLKFDVEMTWEQYARLLGVMADVGLVERGYYNASMARGESFLRLPWIKK